MSLRCKSYSYIREPNENERHTSSSSYILFFSFLSISFLVYNTIPFVQGLFRVLNLIPHVTKYKNGSGCKLGPDLKMDPNHPV